MARRPLDRSARVTGDAASHAGYGVGPATDYGADIGEEIKAIISGALDVWYSQSGGRTTRITHPTLDLFVIIQHQNAYAMTTGQCREGDLIGYVGNSGTATSGPHIHAYAIYKGERISLERLMAIMGGTETPINSHTPALSGAGSGYEIIEESVEDMKAIRNGDGSGSIGTVSPDGTLDGLTLAEFDSLKRIGMLGDPGYVQESDGTVWNALTARTVRIRAVQSADPAALAASVAALVIPALAAEFGTRAGFTLADIQNASEAAIRSVFSDAAVA